MTDPSPFIRWYDTLTLSDHVTVGHKNALLGELRHRFSRTDMGVPDGFAVTDEAYRLFIDSNGLREPIAGILNEFDEGHRSLQSTGRAVRRLILHAEFPPPVKDAIIKAYLALSKKLGTEEADVAVRSALVTSGPNAIEHASLHESFLHVAGYHEVLDACRRCYASLFTDRAIALRSREGQKHLAASMAVGVQQMVRADRAGAGVLRTLDPETGFPRAVVIEAGWGLGDSVINGLVEPDHYMVFKPLLENARLRPIIEKRLGEKAHKIIYTSGLGQTIKSVETPAYQRNHYVLSDDEVLRLAKWAAAIEKHFGKPISAEWAKDARTDELFIVEISPCEAYRSRKPSILKSYRLREEGRVIAKGISVGTGITSGQVCRISSPSQIDQFPEDAILVAERTDPDWVPIMQKAAGIITDLGGKTSHAAFISREMGIPAIVGAGNATAVLRKDHEVTLVCNEGAPGLVMGGLLRYESTEVDLDEIPETRTRIMMNIGTPDAAFRWWQLPCHGIGLARMEFIVSEIIKIHPMALIHFETLADRDEVRKIKELTRTYKDKKAYFVDKLAQGIGKIAASQYPNPVIVRMSDFKSDEYAGLLGGAQFERPEANPMIGFRGASRYYSERYREGFALECMAIKRVREEMGFDNVIVMIPFCRTIPEAQKVLRVMAAYGLERRLAGLQLYMMCEVPSNVILADRFAEFFDGFSIGSNDLTQLALGVDRNSAEMAHLFDERDETIQRMISSVIETAHFHDRKVGICGQAPSEYPEFCRFLVACGIDAISLNPDSVLEVKRQVALAEKDIAGTGLESVANSRTLVN